jgi:hypothetical protein
MIGPIDREQWRCLRHGSLLFRLDPVYLGSTEKSLRLRSLELLRILREPRTVGCNPCRIELRTAKSSGIEQYRTRTIQ